MLFMSVTAPGNCRGFPCCTKSVNNPSYDPKGTAYGFENGESCVSIDKLIIGCIKCGPDIASRPSSKTEPES